MKYKVALGRYIHDSQRQAEPWRYPRRLVAIKPLRIYIGSYVVMCDVCQSDGTRAPSLLKVGSVAGIFIPDIGVCRGFELWGEFLISRLYVRIGNVATCR